MANYELKNWGGVFDESTHTYTLDGKELSGITSVIKRQLFPNEYKDVPKFVLERAAAKGTEVHRLCEEYDQSPFKTIRDAEVEHYAEITKGMNYECSEYIVTDGKNYASAIDKVYRIDETTFDLGDIKHTSVPNIPYVTWQLSIYAYFFELMNVGAKVRNLYLLYVRGENSKRYDITRIPSEEVKRLLDCDVKGETFTPSLDTMMMVTSEPEAQLPTQYTDLMIQLRDRMQEIKKAEEEKKSIAKALQEAMEKYNVKKVDNEYLTITRVDETTRVSLNAQALKTDHPDIYIKYAKTSKVSGSVKITLKTKK